MPICRQPFSEFGPTGCQQSGLAFRRHIQCPAGFILPERRDHLRRQTRVGPATFGFRVGSRIVHVHGLQRMTTQVGSIFEKLSRARTLAKLVHGVMQPRLHRANRDFQRLGNLAQIETFDEAQTQNLTMFH